jgi:hypothetical protein
MQSTLADPKTYPFSHFKTLVYDEPRFDSGFTRLSDSGSTQRWLSSTGAKLSFMPFHDELLVDSIENPQRVLTLHGAAVVLLEPQAHPSGTYILSIPAWAITEADKWQRDDDAGSENDA